MKVSHAAGGTVLASRSPMSALIAALSAFTCTADGVQETEASYGNFHRVGGGFGRTAGRQFDAEATAVRLLPATSLASIATASFGGIQPPRPAQRSRSVTRRSSIRRPPVRCAGALGGDGIWRGTPRIARALCPICLSPARRHA